MAKINFKYLSFKNFMSYGNKLQTIDFEAETNLITGKNGYGKSTIFMALFYALYGKTYKKVKLSSLVNNTNNKDMYTEVSFSINDTEYLIKRGIKPNIFEIYENDVLIDQSASIADYQEYLETYILKIPEHVFKQLIFFGANVSGNKTFMELTKAEKEAMFGIITDTSVFGLIRDNINQKIKETKTSLTELAYKEQVLKESIIQEQANIAKLEAHNAEANAINESNKANAESDVIEVQEKITALKQSLEKIKTYKPKYEELTQKIDALKKEQQSLSASLNEIESQLHKINTAKNSFSLCIGCDKLSKISSVDISKESALVTEAETIRSYLTVINDSLQDYKAKTKKLYDKLLEGKGTKETLSALENQREKMLASMNQPSVNIIEIDYNNLKNLQSKYKKVKDKELSVTQYQQSLGTLLKLMDNNNLKGVILNQQLPLLNKYINVYLSEFSSEFKFNFFIDQNFKENIVLKNKEFEVHSLSNGYNLRLTFSIMFAFLRLVQERSGIDTNILVLDEALDSALDSEGRTELLDIIKKDFSEKSVFVISHNNEIKNQNFQRTFVVNNNGFSSLEEI